MKADMAAPHLEDGVVLALPAFIPYP
jgi:hypothetical protein